MPQHIYFKGINGLRFLAALAVIITHVELLKAEMGLESFYTSFSGAVFELGSLGVIFFFVLSGFLITYLLLTEKKQEGTIHIRHFYLRRIYRIWPLYFLIVLLGFFVLPRLDFIKIPYFDQFSEAQFSVASFLLFMFMLPNLAFAMFHPAYVGHTWSIGVEEQFYLFWPLLMKRAKNVPKMLLGVIITLLAVKMVVLLAYKLFPQYPELTIIKDFVAMIKVESMAIGGFGAWTVFEDRYFHKLLNNYILAASIFASATLIYFTPPFIQDGIFLVYSALFLIIILNVALNPSSFIKLENKLFIFLGTISYGIYMYHFMVVAAVIGLLRVNGFPVGNSLLSQLIVYGSSIGLSILVSGLSYRYFEKWFLKKKLKISSVESGTP